MAIAATTSAGTPTNALQSLQFGAATNALVDVPGQPAGQTGNFGVNLPAATTTATFTVRPAVAGQAVTVSLTAVDACGTWPTFVGGGPAVFQSGASPAVVGVTPTSAPTRGR